MKEGFIGKNGNGVPAWLFDQPNFSGAVAGGSGATLLCTLRPDAISIEDAKKRFEYCFIAKTSKGVLYPSMHTRALEGEKIVRHPDLFAGMLIGQALIFFAQYAAPIHTVHTSWHRPYQPDVLRDNFTTFLQQVGNAKTASREAVEAAVRETPSYRIHSRYGFTHIDDISFQWEDRELKTVRVDFTPV